MKGLLKESFYYTIGNLMSKGIGLISINSKENNLLLCFITKDFSEEGDTIRVEVSKIIENLSDVEEFNLEPVLNIRHDSTRTATGGLRATVQPENLLYRDGKLTGNKIEIPYKDIM